MASIFECRVPQTINEKREFLLLNHIALWDAVASCEITGSADSSIKNVTANDITPILKTANIHKIYVNGKTALKYYNKYIKNTVKREAICLPFTSPANAAWSTDALCAAWIEAGIRD